MKMQVPNETTAPSPVADKGFREFPATTSPKMDYAMGLPGQETSPMTIVPYPGTDTQPMPIGQGVLPINERMR